MKRLIRKTNAFLKAILLWFRPGVYLGFLSNPFLFLANFLSLTRWIAKQNPSSDFSDFVVLTRDYSRRYNLYKHVLKSKFNGDEPIDYLEFGVSGGFSFKWWAQNNLNPESRFFGFDTFEGLPEAWGTYKRGDMSAIVPELDDKRCSFIKGLFQETLFDFMKNTKFSNSRKVIHLDADLFSSTLFVLTTLAPALKKGDILLFDEFNVPNHEWMAYNHFSKSFYIKTELIGSVNNYFQVAFIIL